MKKRIIVYAAFVFFLLGFFGFFALVELCHEPTKANYDRLEIGMTKSEVRGILGGEPDYSGEGPVNGQVWANVEGATGTAMLAFGADDRLTWKHWNEQRRRPPPPTLYERWESLAVSLEIMKIRE